MKKKLAIIGGGVSGLTAGIYAQMSGMESTVYEQHSIAGGELTGWERQGCHIDNCVHWLVGTAPESDIHNTWLETGALTGEPGSVIQNEAFFRVVDGNGNVLNLWQDLDRLRDDMIAVSAADRELIDEFIADTKLYRCVDMPATKPYEQLGLLETLRLAKKMKPVAKRHRVLSKISIPEYAARFRSPLIRLMLNAYFPYQYNVSSLMYVLAHFSMGNAALPRGGSLAMARRIEERYGELGGTVRTRHRAEKIVIDNGKARQIIFDNGTTIQPDYIICACDASITYKQLIGKEYMDKKFRMWYTFGRKYPVHSSVNLYLKIDDPCTDLPDTTIFQCRPYTVGGTETQQVLLKCYNSEPEFAPAGCCLCQTIHLQYASEYEFWVRLRRSDPAAYRREKQRVANEVIARIEEYMPRLKGKVSCVESVTPASFERFCGAYCGSYMGFILTPHAPKVISRGTVKGVDNIYLASQWLQPPGGLPNAHLAGKFAVQRLCRHAKIHFHGYTGK